MGRGITEGEVRIVYSVIESITVSNKIEKTSPKFCEHSNLMESHGLRMEVEKLKDFSTDSGICA